MSAFLYGVALQWKLDIRSKSLLITCYIVPLLFFAIMGGIFTALMPEAKNTLIQSMTVMGVSMGAFLGLPATLVETYGSDRKKVYQANGVPLYLGLVSMYLSAFAHLLLMSILLYLAAPLAFHAAIPASTLAYFGALVLFIAVSLSVGCVLGLAVKNQAKLTMISQLLFLPSIMLSGIMFSIALLPKAFVVVGGFFPASWGYRLMVEGGFRLGTLWPLLAIFLLAAVLCGILLKRMQADR